MRLLPRAALLLAVVATCTVALGYAAERILQRRTGQSWLLNGWNDLGPTVYDPLLGWTSPPSTHWPDLYGPGRHCTFNGRGFRATQEHAKHVPEGRSRVLCLGDSFMAGLGVGDESTIPAHLESLDPRLQAVNMAKISYGLDQIILRYERDGESLDSDIVLLTAIDDNLNRARWSHFFGYWPKPRFMVAGGGLELTGVPVPDFSTPAQNPADLFRRSALYLLPHQYIAEQTYSQDDEELVQQLLDRFRRVAEKRGHRPAVAYFPTLPELTSGELLPLHALLAAGARRFSLPFVDVPATLSRLEQAEAQESFLEVNEHYSEKGGRRVAEAILAALPLASP